MTEVHEVTAFQAKCGSPKCIYVGPLRNLQAAAQVDAMQHDVEHAKEGEKPRAVEQ